MAALVIGGVVLVLGLWLLRLFADAPVETVRKVLIWTGGALGVVLVLTLLLSGRGIQAMWGLTLFAPLLWRWSNGLRSNWRFRRGSADAGNSGAAGETTVETAWLTMRLQHGSGEMSGRIRQGRFAGRELAELRLRELRDLLEECRNRDPESVPLLEAWMDRAAPDWRQAETEDATSAAAGRMDRAEALRVLGLKEGATEAEIRAAHRRLMQTSHPDRGGSDWLAAKVNQARDILLRRS